MYDLGQEQRYVLRTLARAARGAGVRAAAVFDAELDQQRVYVALQAAGDADAWFGGRSGRAVWKARSRSDGTFREDAQETRTGNQPIAHVGIRNLVTGAFRKKGHANIAAARRYYGRGEQRILALHGCA